MKTVIFLLLLLVSFNGLGQENRSDSLTKTSLETVAVFPDGQHVFRNLISQNFRMDLVEGSGKIHSELTFVVERDGSISDIKATGENESFNKEAISAVSKITKKWIPAELNGEKVRYRFRVPLDITFQDALPSAEFPQGEEVFKSLIATNLRKDKIKSSGVEECVITFVVGTDGSISQIRTSGKNRIFNKEVLRSVSKINQKWNPKLLRELPVPSPVTILFTMNFP